jgi:hypothetical protein
MGRRLAKGLAAAACLCALAAPTGAQAARDSTVWLCKPGMVSNPCKPGMGTTRISPTGEVLGVDNPKAARKPKVDCFYVYPTVSDDPTPNSDLSIDPEERSIALYQAARFSLNCRVYAPMYRQLTLAAILDGGAGITEEQRDLAYNDVVKAWQNYLRRYNKRRGIILIGHSQGTYLLRQLIADRVDYRAGVRERMIAAYLLGGNVVVPEGELVGGDFDNIPGCTKPKEINCVVGFSTFDEPVPADARFGRPGNVINPDFVGEGDVLCTNPAALRGGSAQLRTVHPAEPFAPGTTIGLGTELVGIPRPTVTTPWIQAEGYAGACSSADDADVLQIAPVGGAPDLNAIPDPSWGLHLIDANIALGNLTALAARQIKAYEKSLRPLH